MTAEEQQAAGCRIGAAGDYPERIVDHHTERRVALRLFQETKAAVRP
jgi:hypothetical protein